MSLAVDVAGLVAVAEVDEQLLAGATLEARRVPHAVRRRAATVRRRLRHDDRHPTGFYADTAASASLHTRVAGISRLLRTYLTKMILSHKTITKSFCENLTLTPDLPPCLRIRWSRSFR